MKAKIFSLFGIALLAFLQSCSFQSETVISVNKDGSGTISETAVVRIPNDKFKKGGGDKLANDFLASMKSGARDQRRSEQFGEGVSFFEDEEIEPNAGSRGLRVTYQFRDINELSIPLTGNNREKNPENKVTFLFNDGRLTINLPKTNQDGNAAKRGELETEGFDPEDPNILGELGPVVVTKDSLKGVKLGFKIVFPEGIKRTNSTFQKGQTITLFEIDCDELIKTSKGVSVIKKLLQSNAPQNLPDEGKKLKGIKVEPKNEVVVTLK
ncbi:MAG: hypothetical protein ABF391_17850 [Akkermansiaceae bacterium]